ncbi:hypothetical protein MMAG44476_20094 [Mycolicibacterium mageritense DSM 44476 = CIP 104973]
MTPETKDHGTAVRVWHAILILSVIASVAVNTAHGVLGADDDLTARIVAGALGAIPPLVFFALVEALLKTFRTGVYGWLYWTLIIGTVSAASAAFTLSFIAVLDFARDYAVMSSMWIAWLFPIMFDVVMALSTLAIFALGDKPMKRVKKAKASKVEESIATIGLLPKARIRLFGGAATVPTLPPTPHRQVIDSPPSTVQRQPIDSLATPTPVNDTPSSTLPPTPKPVAEAVNDAADDSDIDIDSLSFAAAVADRAKVKQTPGVVHRVIEVLRETDGNLSEASRAVSLSRDPARRIRDALAELEAEERHALTVVG